MTNAQVIAFPRRGGFDPRLDKRQAAQYMGVSLRSFERLMAEGVIEADRPLRRPNEKRRFRLSDLERAMKGQHAN